MFGGMRAERGAECVSDLRFDAWLAGELSAPSKASMSAHVEGCARCRARRDALVGARQRFEASPAASLPAFLRPELAGARRPMTALALGVVGLAAAFALVFLAEREPAGERIKGGEQVSYFVKRGQSVQRGARAQRVQPGDQLRFTYSTPAPRHLAILSLDAANEVSVYFPAGERTARVAPGVEVALPSAVELDAVLGEERVFILFCKTEQALAPLRAQLASPAHTLEPPSGCSLDQLLLTKEARPR